MSELDLLTAPEVAARVRMHPVTIRLALETGELHGYQRVARGRWKVDAKCVDAWLANEQCEHQLPVVQRGSLRLVGGQR